MLPAYRTESDDPLPVQLDENYSPSAPSELEHSSTNFWYAKYNKSCDRGEHSNYICNFNEMFVQNSKFEKRKCVDICDFCLALAVS